MRRRWWQVLWRLGRRPVRGCRVLAIDPAGRVLLIRHSYGDRSWMLPGGGIDRGEAVTAAAARELFEETACRLAPVVALGLAEDPGEAMLHEVHLVAGWTADAPRADGREIVVAAFHPLDALPEPMSGKLAASLPGYVTRAKAARPPG